MKWTKEEPSSFNESGSLEYSSELGDISWDLIGVPTRRPPASYNWSLHCYELDLDRCYVMKHPEDAQEAAESYIVAMLNHLTSRCEDALEEIREEPEKP